MSEKAGKHTSPLSRWQDAVTSDELEGYSPVHTAGEALRYAVPLHFGDPSGEQWALEQGCAIVDRADLAVIRIGGQDRHSWLTSISTQIIDRMGLGDSRELLILDPQGHIEYAAAVLDDTESTWLITEGFAASRLVGWLESMRFLLRVEVELVEDVTVLGTVGHSSLNGFSGARGYLMTWEDPWPGPVPGGTEYHQGRHPGEEVDFFLHIVRADEAETLARHWVEAHHGRRAAGVLAWEALRIACWRPRVGYEVDARTVPAEVDWLRTAVHLNKGCYRGQESVARIVNLGRPPRRLTFLQLDGSRGDLPRLGQEIMHEGRRVGVVTSVARHADMGPIALALLLRNLPVETPLDLEGIAAAQEEIVPPHGRASASPAQRPGSELRGGGARRTRETGTDK